MPPRFTVAMAPTPCVVTFAPLAIESVPLLPLLVSSVPPAATFAAAQVTPGPRSQTADDPLTSTSASVAVSPGRLVATPTRPPSTYSLLPELLPLMRRGSAPLSADGPVESTVPLNAADPKSSLMRPDPPNAVPSGDGAPIVQLVAPIFQ